MRRCYGAIQSIILNLPSKSIGVIAVCGGSWDLVATSIWVYNHGLHNWPYAGYLNTQLVTLERFRRKAKCSTVLRSGVSLLAVRHTVHGQVSSPAAQDQSRPPGLQKTSHNCPKGSPLFWTQVPPTCSPPQIRPSFPFHRPRSR